MVDETLVLEADVGEGTVGIEHVRGELAESLGLFMVAGRVEHPRGEFQHQHVVHVHVGVVAFGRLVLGPLAVALDLELGGDLRRREPFGPLAGQHEVGIGCAEQQVSFEGGDEAEAVDVGVVAVDRLRARG